MDVPVLASLVLASPTAAGTPFVHLVPWSNVTYDTLSQDVLEARPYGADPANSTWAIEASCCGYGPFTEAAVSNTSRKFGLFRWPCGRPGTASISEWGYEYHHFPTGAKGTPCGDHVSAAYPHPPANRAQAAARLQAYFRCRVAAMGPSPCLLHMPGHYFYHHYGLMWGAACAVATEVGENINSVNAHLAFARGAARQFAVPFTIDFSAWMQGYILDYSSLKPWGKASSPTGGHSLSLFQRAYRSSYMAGATSLIAEAGAVNWFLQSTTADGCFELSPLGSIGRDLADLAHGTGPLRGLAYAPVLLVLQQDHGMGLGWWYQGKAWDTFPLRWSHLFTSPCMPLRALDTLPPHLSPGEQACADLFQDVWPGSWHVENQFHTPQSESGYLVASPYGEIFDVALPSNLSSHFMQAYRAAVLTGDVNLTTVEAGALSAFVQAGGVLVASPEHLDALRLHSQDLLLPAKLGTTTTLEQVANISDVWGWSAPFAAPHRPFCVQQDSGTGWYIKVGGDPKKTNGWDGGQQDKMIESQYSSVAPCEPLATLSTS
eukprot:gene8523-211_t